MPVANGPTSFDVFTGNFCHSFYKIYLSGRSKHEFSFSLVYKPGPAMVKHNAKHSSRLRSLGRLLRLPRLAFVDEASSER